MLTVLIVIIAQEPDLMVDLARSSATFILFLASFYLIVVLTQLKRRKD